MIFYARKIHRGEVKSISQNKQKSFEQDINWLKKKPIIQKPNNQANCRTADPTSIFYFKEPTNPSPGLKSWNLET